MVCESANCIRDGENEMKHLALEVIHIVGTCTVLRIIEQTHFGSEFSAGISGDDSSNFSHRCADGENFFLSASLYRAEPEVVGGGLRVWGCFSKAIYSDAPSKWMVAPSAEWTNRLRETVAAYNTKFGNIVTSQMGGVIKEAIS